MLGFIVNVLYFFSRIFSSLVPNILRLKRAKLEWLDLLFISLVVFYFSKGAFIVNQDLHDDVFYTTGCPYSIPYSKWRVCSKVKMDQTTRTLQNFVGARNMVETNILMVSKSAEFRILAAVTSHFEIFSFCLLFVLTQWIRGRKAINPFLIIVFEIILVFLHALMAFFEYDSFIESVSTQVKFSAIRLILYGLLSIASVLLSRTPVQTEDDLYREISRKIRTIEQSIQPRN